MKIFLAFNNIVKQIHVLLKKNGFKKHGNVFYKQRSDNWGLISFQKSMSSTSTEISFTINLGICSHSIVKFFNPEKIEKKPTIEDCHLRMRIGDLIRNGQDVWWMLNGSTNLVALIQEIEELVVEYVLPTIEQLISDEQLESEWRSKLPGRLDFQPKLNLAILLKKSGKIDELTLLLKQLEKETEGKPTTAFFNVVKNDLLNTN